MRITRPLVLTASAALLAATLSACSEGGGGGLTYEDSPLNEYLSAAWGDDQSPEEYEKQYEEQSRQAEELIAECMAAEGFEYTPNTGSGGAVFSSSDDEWDPDSREWVSQYGYGVFTDPWADEEPIAEEEYVDPNADYVSSLSESEQIAYNEVLNGEQPPEEAYDDPDFDWDGFDWDSLEPGCYGNAWEEVQGEDATQALYEEYQPLMDRINLIYEGLQDSPEMSDLNAEWASCMADAGFAGYTAQTDASQEFYDAQDAFYTEQNAQSEELDWDDATQEEIDAFSEETDPSNSPEWKEKAEREIEVALADLDCKEETGYSDESLRIQFALEEQFIADNEAELEAFKAAAEQAG
ncbi:hypothetical protein N8K70_11300 [Microbacterium betulae]|uniref:Uncharacterized protein n=1 Tax=Microbacterium betulae TaxID=2981139 RepID=A0AA97FGQ6_9MICO|nr:hypothetical protein [Microbacterium sp. AB]WOF21965.1 hypothetical protein N8K70_11300 [Microbacterium sp. AB]